MPYGDMNIGEAAGTGKCALCDKPIPKGRPTIVYRGYRTSMRCHALPWDCKVLAKAALDDRGKYISPLDARDRSIMASS